MTSLDAGRVGGDEAGRIDVKWVADGAAELAEVAVMLEDEAQRLHDLAAMGWRLREPVDGGHGELEPPALDNGVVISVNVVTGAIEVETGGWPADARRWPVITSPGEAGLSIPDVARDMGFPWKESGPEAQPAAVPSQEASASTCPRVTQGEFPVRRRRRPAGAERCGPQLAWQPRGVP